MNTHRPVILLVVWAVILFLLIYLSVAIGLGWELNDWSNNVTVHLGWLITGFALCLLILGCGYLWLPAVLITIKLEQQEAIGSSGIEKLKILLDGRSIELHYPKLPMQFKVYFRRRGEYTILVNAKYKSDGADAGGTSGHDHGQTYSSKTYSSKLNLYEAPVGDVVISLDAQPPKTKSA
jgi:hypothetical protein